MKISVTQEMIERGFKRDCRMCPVALAVVEAGGVNPIVGQQSIQWMPNRTAVYVRASTPEPVVQFIRSFDKGEQVSPFEFELEKK